SEKLSSRFGVMVGTKRYSGQRMVELAQRAERLGFNSFWLAESYHFRSAVPIAGAMATATSRIKIALGIVPTHTRHPALNAMDAVTLDELSGGRFIAGVGTSARAAKIHK